MWAFDALKAPASDADWPPPPRPIEVMDARAALTEAQRVLREASQEARAGKPDTEGIQLAAVRLARLLATWT